MDHVAGVGIAVLRRDVLDAVERPLGAEVRVPHDGAVERAGFAQGDGVGPGGSGRIALPDRLVEAAHQFGVLHGDLGRHDVALGVGIAAVGRGVLAGADVVVGAHDDVLDGLALGDRPAQHDRRCVQRLEAGELERTLALARRGGNGLAGGSVPVEHDVGLGQRRTVAGEVDRSRPQPVGATDAQPGKAAGGAERDLQRDAVRECLVAVGHRLGGRVVVGRRVRAPRHRQTRSRCRQAPALPPGHRFVEVQGGRRVGRRAGRLRPLTDGELGVPLVDELLVERAGGVGDGDVAAAPPVQRAPAAVLALLEDIEPVAARDVLGVEHGSIAGGETDRRVVPARQTGVQRLAPGGPGTGRSPSTAGPVGHRCRRRPVGAGSGRGRWSASAALSTLEAAESTSTWASP